MIIYAIKVEYYNEFESYKCFYKFADSLEEMQRIIAYLRRSEFGSAKITKITYKAEEIDKVW